MASSEHIAFPALPFDLKDHVVVITGAGQGIGRVFAHKFAAAGAIPVIAEIDERKAQAVVAEIEGSGGRAWAVRTDVGDEASTDAMARAVMDKFSRLDALINNAGFFSTLKMRPFDQIPSAEWDEVLRINITGVFNCCRSVVPYMREAERGRIINISSAAVTMGRPNYLHYTTSKAALLGMTRSLARELGKHGITVNAILPGATYTEIERATVTPEQKAAIVSMQCIPRPESPEDLAGPAMFLASDAARFMTGQGLTVDGGATHS
jgi:NAD(P)-dependent dehydrogenase (short-subunit alcohol dehydrogenase family)